MQAIGKIRFRRQCRISFDLRFSGVWPNTQNKCRSNRIIPRRCADLSVRWSVSSATPGKLAPSLAPRKSGKRRSRKVRRLAVPEDLQAIAEPFVEKQQDLRFVAERQLVPDQDRHSPSD